MSETKTANAPKVARGYIRESTARQGEKFGPDAQRQAIRRAARELGVTLDETRWYTDLVSGTGRVVRDELARAIVDARAGELEVLVCYDTSRFARNERLAFAFEDELRRAGARVYYALERIWADDEDQAMPKGIFHVINAEYSRKLSRRIRDGLAAKRARGGYAGGVPWGYRFSGDRMSLERTAEHALRIRIWNDYATGKYTLATLADRLTAEGHSIRSRPFTKFTLHEILRRNVDVRIGGLSRETYDRVQAILASRRDAMAKVGKRRRSYLFADLARCADCGERFIGRALWRPGATAPILQLKHPLRGCRHGIRNEDLIRDRIGQWLDGWCLPSDVRVRIARYLRRRAAGDPHAERRGRVEAAIARLRKQHEWGAIPDGDFLEEHTRLASTLAELAPPAIVPAPSEDALKLADQIGTAWGRVSDERRREFLTEWFTAIRIARDGGITMVPREQYAPIVYAAVSRYGGLCWIRTSDFCDVNAAL